MQVASVELFPEGGIKGPQVGEGLLKSDFVVAESSDEGRQDARLACVFALEGVACARALWRRIRRGAAEGFEQSAQLRGGSPAFGGIDGWMLGVERGFTSLFRVFDRVEQRFHAGRVSASHHGERPRFEFVERVGAARGRGRVGGAGFHRETVWGR